MIYTETVLDHFTKPRNVGEIEDADAIGEVGNPQCGDIMKMYLKIDKETHVITDIKFKTFGCGAAIASSSLTTTLIKGKTLEEALKMTNKEVVDALGGLPPQKIHCSVLAEEAIKSAVSDYYRKNGIKSDLLLDCENCEVACEKSHFIADGESDS
jgi:nitrogen fixation NifU-like protein